jgi:hypothetical protein
MSRMTLAFMASMTAPTWAGGLVDNPIAASTLVPLDSSSTVEWTASVSGGSPAGCSFQQDMDWLPHAWLSELAGIATADECCAKCWAETLCAASVHVAAENK